MVSVQYLLVIWMMHIIIFSLFGFDKKKGIKNLNIAFFISLAILDLVRYLYDGYHSVKPYDSPLVLGIVVLIMIYSLEGYKKISLWSVVIASLFISSFVSTTAVSFLLGFLGIYMRDMNDNPISSIIGMISGLILLQMLDFAIKRFNIKIDIHNLSTKDVLMIILFLSVFGIYINNLHIIINENIAGQVIFMNMLSLLAGSIPVYGIIYIISQKDYIRYVEASEKEQELLFEEERISYQKMNERNEEIRIFKHDIDDELDYLQQLAQSNDFNEVSEHIAKMKGETAKIVKSVVHYTGSTATNASWYALTSNEKYADVKCEWLGKLPQNIVMDNRDIVRLFSNLLKNAFEATIQSKFEKYVTVKIIAERSRLVIIVKNSYQGEISLFNDGTLKTTKLEKEKHGIGTRIIKDIVVSYNGKINYDYDGSKFVARIIFGANIYQSI